MGTKVYWLELPYKISSRLCAPFSAFHPKTVLLSDVSDIALVKNNALIGAKIAVALSNLQQRETNSKLLSLLSLNLTFCHM